MNGHNGLGIGTNELLNSIGIQVKGLPVNIAENGANPVPIQDVHSGRKCEWSRDYFTTVYAEGLKRDEKGYGTIGKKLKCSTPRYSTKRRSNSL
jgi:hypothetical protein